MRVAVGYRDACRYTNLKDGCSPGLMLQAGFAHAGKHGKPGRVLGDLIRPEMLFIPHFFYEGE